MRATIICKRSMTVSPKFQPSISPARNTSPVLNLVDGMGEMTDTPRTNLQQIAQKLGLSLSTVSRCLRGDPRFARDTIAQVRQVADELGYRPDPMLSALAGYRERKRQKLPQATLAWLHPYPANDPKKRHRFSETFAGASTRAEQLGYRLLPLALADTSDVPAAQRIITARGIEGAAIYAMHLAPSCMTLDFSRLAVVSVGYLFEKPRFHAIAPHYFRNALVALDELMRRDSKRIGLVLFNDADIRAGHLVRAAFGYCREIISHVAWIPPLVLTTGLHSATKQFRQWCLLHQPDAILTDDWFVTEELLHLGLRVADDVNVALTDTAHATALGSGIFENPRIIGARAIEQLVGFVQQREYGVPSTVQHTFVEGDWSEGQTVRPLTDATPEELSLRQKTQENLRTLPSPSPEFFEPVLPDIGYGPGVPAPHHPAKAITTVAKI